MSSHDHSSMSITIDMPDFVCLRGQFQTRLCHLLPSYHEFSDLKSAAMDFACPATTGCLLQIGKRSVLRSGPVARRPPEVAGSAWVRCRAAHHYLATAANGGTVVSEGQASSAGAGTVAGPQPAFQVCCLLQFEDLARHRIIEIERNTIRFEVSFQSLFWKCKSNSFKKIKILAEPVAGSQQWQQAPLLLRGDSMQVP